MKHAQFVTTMGDKGLVNLIPGQVENLQHLMISKGISFGLDSTNPVMSVIGNIFPWIFGYALGVILLNKLRNAQMGGSSEKNRFSKNINAEMTSIKFSDVAGIDEAK